MSALHLLVENVPDVTSSLAIQETREKERASSEQLKEQRRRRSLGDDAPSDRLPGGFQHAGGSGRAHSRSSLTAAPTMALIAENAGAASSNPTPAAGAERELSAVAPAPADAYEPPPSRKTPSTAHSRPEQGLLLYYEYFILLILA